MITPVTFINADVMLLFHVTARPILKKQSGPMRRKQDITKPIPFFIIL